MLTGFFPTSKVRYKFANKFFVEITLSIDAGEVIIVIIYCFINFILGNILAQGVVDVVFSH